MFSWAAKRQMQYLGIVVVAVFLFFVLPFFVFLYEPPSCFDGRKNQGEAGVDCGGPCRLLCPADIIEPILRWDPRIFKVSGDVYSLLAYIENPNMTAESSYAPYVFKIYDDRGVFITEKRGETFIPRAKTFAVFGGNINIGQRTPSRVTFEFEKNLNWTRSVNPEPDIEIKTSSLLNEETSPRVEAVVRNRTFDRLSNIEFVVIVFDGAGNAIGASRTFVESLSAGSQKNIVFTWPMPFETKSEACSAPVDVALALDRSGSMASLGADPPQPLTDVKNSAISFIGQLGQNDKVAVISFANEATFPIEQGLTSSLDSAKNAVNSIEIGIDGIQYTNIADALIKSRDELNSSRQQMGARKVVVLLTDGIANKPEKEEDEGYPERYAMQIATESAKNGIKIFTIGLGDDINRDFLRNVASSTSEFYLAPTSEDLFNIYTSIATAICQKRPAKIEIISRIYPK